VICLSILVNFEQRQILVSQFLCFALHQNIGIWVNSLTQAFPNSLSSVSLGLYLTLSSHKSCKQRRVFWLIENGKALLAGSAGGVCMFEQGYILVWKKQ
jgi:hypothetical protein